MAEDPSQQVMGAPLESSPEPSSSPPQVGLGGPLRFEEEVQPVRSLPPEPEPPQKILGEFDSTEDARVELERLRSFRDAVSRDQGVQQLVQQRQQEQAQVERAKLAVQQEEQSLLENYAEAVSSGNPDKALLTLVREIRKQANSDAQFAIRRELDSAVAPIRSKAQLLESTAWADLHPVADEASWLAGELGKLGHSKPAVAEFLRNVGQKYSGSNARDNREIQEGTRRSTPQPRGNRLESPDSRSVVPSEDKSWDKFVRNYWDNAL